MFFQLQNPANSTKLVWSECHIKNDSLTSLAGAILGNIGPWWFLHRVRTAMTSGQQFLSRASGSVDLSSFARCVLLPEPPLVYLLIPHPMPHGPLSLPPLPQPYQGNKQTKTSYFKIINEQNFVAFALCR